MNQVHLKNNFQISDNNYYTNNLVNPSYQVNNYNSTSNLSKTPNKYSNRIMMNNYSYNTNTNTNTETSNNERVNFFGKSKSKPKITTSVINDRNNVIVNRNDAFQNNVESYKFLNAHKPTDEEKKLIPHPKQKIKGFKNPFISQIKIK